MTTKPITNTVADIPDDELLRRAVKAALSSHYNKGVRHMRWVAVSHVFGLGSTYANQLCHRFGLNPDQEVKR